VTSRAFPVDPTPARLVSTLQRADLASEQGRVLIGSDSAITGTVRGLESEGRPADRAESSIQGENKGVKGGAGLAGLAVAMAINAAMTKSQEALAEKLAVSFTKNVKTWLTPK